MTATIQYLDGKSGEGWTEEFEQIRILPNGWAKCTGPKDDLENPEDTTVHIPPHRIDEIYGDSVYYGDPGI